MKLLVKSIMMRSQSKLLLVEAGDLLNRKESWQCVVEFLNDRDGRLLSFLGTLENKLIKIQLISAGEETPFSSVHSPDYQIFFGFVTFIRLPPTMFDSGPICFQQIFTIFNYSPKRVTLYVLFDKL